MNTALNTAVRIRTLIVDDEPIARQTLKDYCALEMYAGNVDWPSNNLKYWKPSITEGKWRYLLRSETF